MTESFNSTASANTAGSDSKKATLRGSPNQKTSEMKICEPWSFVPNIPPHAARDKAAFRSWSAEKTTDHLYYSASEGVWPTLRVNKATNPLKKLHGFIADYDAKTTLHLVEKQLAKWSGEFEPNWISRTFSDHVRVIWFFEEPLLMDCSSLVDPFLKLAAEELRLKKFLPGLDEGAWADLSRIYEVGRDWRQIAHSPLSKHQLCEMLFRALKKVRWESDGPLIPLEVVAEWVEQDFPGRWDGPFEEGNRGCAFFDPDSTNPTAAIVTEAGMICFSQPKMFYRWRELFPRRAKRYNEDRIGGAVADSFYDGRYYWRKNSNGVFIHMLKEDFVTKLKVQYGLHASKDRFESHSEVDAVVHFVHEQRRVDGAIPLLYEQNDVIHSNGKRFVNSSRVRVTRPEETKQEWAENFPWIASFLDNCWDKVPVACVVKDEPAAYAKEIFLAWFKRFYCSALQGCLLKGHALFNVGPVNTGKTLLSVRVVGGALGGYSEASDFLSGATNFNRELIEMPLWCIDDGTLNSDAGSHQKFSEIIKRTVANPSFSYHPKFHDQQRAEWRGRVIVTLNSDATSVRMIPNLDASLEDKVIILKFADQKMAFPADVEAIIARELPFFLRWLIDWEVPARIVGENRFGIKAFIHEGVRAAAICSGDTGDILEIVESWIWRSGSHLRDTYGVRWHGTATEWITEISKDDGLRPLASKFTARAIGKRFSEASRIRGTRVTLDPSTAKLNGNRYFISLEEDAARQQKTVRVHFAESVTPDTQEKQAA
jgi:hypothetical protein